jgi:hypothetical protein
VKELCDIHCAVHSSYVGQVKHVGSSVAKYLPYFILTWDQSWLATYTCQKMDPRWSEGGHVSCCMCKGVFCDSGQKQSRRAPHEFANLSVIQQY